MPTDIKGLRVFVVEDDVAILMLAEDMLEELGCAVAATGTRMTEAIDAAQNCEADVALLDVNLAGQPVYPVAEILDRRGIPLVFCTGYGGDQLDEGWRSKAVLQKPYRIEHLRDVLSAAAAKT